MQDLTKQAVNLLMNKAKDFKKESMPTLTKTKEIIKDVLDAALTKTVHLVERAKTSGIITEIEKPLLTPSTVLELNNTLIAVEDAI